MIHAGGGKKIVYEKVPVDVWVHGVISKIEVDEKHLFRFKGESSEEPAVRFVFQLDGMTYPKRSRWMKPYTTEKANLYKHYLKPLCPSHDPMGKEVDLSRLVDFPVKTMWVNDLGDYQSLSAIRPLRTDLNLILSGQDVAKAVEDGDVPF